MALQKLGCWQARAKVGAGLWAKAEAKTEAPLLPTEGEGRSAHAVCPRSVSKGEVIVSVPASPCTSAADLTLAPGEDNDEELAAVGPALGLSDSPPQLQHIIGPGRFADPPLLWSESERANLLAGSRALPEVNAAFSNLQTAFNSFTDANDPALLPSFDVFLFWCAAAGSFGWVLESAGNVLVYAPGFELIDRVPEVPGDDQLANVRVDYDDERNACAISATRHIEEGEPLVAFDSAALPLERAFALRGRLPYRPVADHDLGKTQLDGDSTEYVAELVETDPLMQAKKEVAATKSLQQSQPFPVFGSQLPAQLYAFLRLARLQEAGELTKVELERDTPVSQLNEYEALQRLLADLRERLYSFPKPGIDEELRIAKRTDSSASRERDVLAAELRYREKEVLRRAMQTVRDKLAPVRGVPTKDGKIENPNADLNEIFETLEAPFRAAKGFFDRLRPSA